MSDAAHQIQRLREHRARPERAVSIGGIVKSTREHATRAEKKLGQLIDLWEELLPPEIAQRTAITGLRGGIAHVVVDSAATAYELDGLLREGLLGRLRSRYAGTLVRVRIRQGELG